MSLEGKREAVDSDALRDKEANSQRGRATTGPERSKDTKTMGNVKFVFDFEEGDGKNKQLLGGKGSGLVEMTQIGLPIPFGFVITTEACRQYYAKSKKLPDGLMAEVTKHMKRLENKTKKGFGNAENPLIVSVRSGAALSMPGMMDTVLNLGTQRRDRPWTNKRSGDERFGWDSSAIYSLFGEIVLKISSDLFRNAMEVLKKERNAVYDTTPSSFDLQGWLNFQAYNRG